jgi:AraC family transcriptional regulator
VSRLEAARFRGLDATEFERPPLTQHTFVLFTGPPDELDLRYEGVKRHRPPPRGSVAVVLAGTPSRWRWRASRGLLHVYLQPGLVGRVAAEAFDLDPGRWLLPPLDALDLPHLRAAMSALDSELAGGAGGSLAVESLANVLSVHLIRHLTAPGRLECGRDGALPRGRLSAVVEYIEEHLGAGPTLEQLAAVVGLNPYHFARQFKAATGLPPHQHVFARGVERQAAPASRTRRVPGGGHTARRLLEPEPILPPFQVRCRRHAGAVPGARKNRLTARKSRQETGRRALYDSVRIGA